MKNALLVGADSKIGSQVELILEGLGTEIIGTSRDSAICFQKGRIHLDLSQDLSEWEIPENIDTVFFCAGVSSLKSCRLNPVSSNFINVTNTLFLMRRFSEKNIHIVFPSTSMVFDGSTPHNKIEGKTNPLNIYGKQKLQVEDCLKKLPRTSIVRLSKVLGNQVKLFGDWVKNLKDSRTIYSFADLRISPIPLEFAARFMVSVAENRYFGTFHAGGNKDVSYYEISTEIADKLGVNPILVKKSTAKNAGIPQSEIPRNTTLDTTISYRLLRMGSPDVWETINKIVK
jgi:dTDP-4-dehydrorhamnose reductase